MFPKSYFVYSVNYLVYSPITYLVYSVNYLVYLPITHLVYSVNYLVVYILITVASQPDLEMPSHLCSGGFGKWFILLTHLCSGGFIECFSPRVGIHNPDELSLAFSKTTSPEHVSQCKRERERERGRVEREGRER